MKLKPVVPFEPVIADHPPKSGQWTSQIKWDGVRVLVYCDGSEVKLINRNLNERTAQYPELLVPAAYCAASSFILDGEIIALDDQKPSFPEVMKRDRLRKAPNIAAAVRHNPITYMVFDLLYCDERWVIDRSLAHRQELLREKLRPGGCVQLVRNFNDPDGLLETMRKHQMEGIVCKDLNSTYTLGGKDDRWQKTKIYHDLIAVVGGVTYRGHVVNALLLGVYDEGKLIYIGHAGTGKLKSEDWRVLTEKIQPFIVKEKTFCNEPERGKGAVWVKPLLTVKVKFLEWTPSRTMRQPSIQAFVDVPPGHCTFQQ